MSKIRKSMAKIPIIPCPSSRLKKNSGKEKRLSNILTKGPYHLIRLIDGLHLPCTNALHFQVSTFAEETDMEILRIIIMPANGGLPDVGKDLDQVLVNEDP